MKIRGNTVGTTMPRANWNQDDPKKADYIIGKESVTKNVFVVGDTVPANKPVLWFNTSPGGAVNSAATLSLEDDEGGYEVQAVVGDETYGVNNATVNQGATSGNYDFTVL